MKRIINYDMILDGGGGSLYHNPLNDVGHFEGECWRDPASLQMKRITKDSEGEWIAVTEEEFNILHPTAANCHMVGGTSYACGCASHAYGCVGNSPYSQAIGYSQTIGEQAMGYCYNPNKYNGAYGNYGSDGADGQNGDNQCWTGMTHTHLEGDYPKVVYDEDDLIYFRHLYRTVLGVNGSNGIGINDFGLHPSVNRDDRELCKKIVNKFNNKMATKFEKRLHAALLRKKEIDEEKDALIEKLNLKKVTAQSRYEQQLQSLRDRGRNAPSGFQSFINELKDERFKGQNERQYVDQVKKDLVTPPKPPKPPVPEKTDDDRVKYYIELVLRNRNQYGVYEQAGKEVDGLRYYDFTFNPAIDEDSTELDIFVELGGKATEFEEKSANEMVRQVTDDDGVPNAVGNFLGKFTKKKTFVKKIRVMYDKILEASKEKYG